MCRRSRCLHRESVFALNNGYQIRALTADDAIPYEEFVQQNAFLPLYGNHHFLNFLENVAECKTHVLLAFAEGRIVGSLPFAIAEREGVGCVVNSLPWYGSHGSVLVGRGLVANAAGEKVISALLAEFARAIDRPDLLSSTMILLPDQESHIAAYEKILRPVQNDRRVSQITELPPGSDRVAENLEAIFKQKTRNLVRKSRKQGFIEAVTDEAWAWDFLVKTHADNMAAIGGRAKPESHFQAMRANLPSEMLRLSVCLSDGAPAAAMLVFKVGNVYEYITPVIVQEFRSRQPLTFLIWTAMLEAVRSGYARWNWGGTWVGQENLHRFKEGLGGIDRPYSYLISATETGVAKLRDIKPQLSSLFPNFYVYPYSEL